MNIDKKDKDLGLYGKFTVTRNDGRDAPGEKHHGCEYFVLDLRHDPGAKEALKAYEEWARNNGYTALADDLALKLNKMFAGTL